MRYRFHIVLFGIVLAMIAGYHGFFTYHVWHLENEVTLEATSADGNIDFSKRQLLLAQRWERSLVKVWNRDFTYRECKGKTLGLGLDLQGGGHFTVGVDQGQVVQKLSAYGKDAPFVEALKEAERAHAQDPSNVFVVHFCAACKKAYPDKQLATIFFQGDEKMLALDASDAEVQRFLVERIREMTKDVRKVLQRRFDPDGTSEVSFSISPQGFIEIGIPGATSEEGIRGLLDKLGKLGFYKVITDSAKSQEIYRQALQEKHLKIGETHFGDLCHMRGGGVWTCDEKHAKSIRTLLLSEDFQLLLPRDVKIALDAKYREENGQKVRFIYLLEQGPDGEGLVEGGAVANASSELSKEGKGWEVQLVMNGQGAEQFAKATRDTVGGILAIVLDDEVYCAPTVPQEITGGRCNITGDFTVEETKQLAKILVSGELPTKVEVLESAIIGPSLGQVAQEEGRYAVLLGLLLILLFMLGYYGLGGFFANMALLLNTLFILGSMTQLHANITMPGIAGLLLTMGMTVDANVLIFERIKEELKSNRYLPAAIAKGYRKAWSSIIDGNVTTLLVGLILYWLGQGPIKGFATTLTIGILCSLFTSVLLVRLMLDTWAYFFPMATWYTFSFLLQPGMLRRPTIDFLRLRKAAYLLSLLFLSTGVGLLIHQGGPNMGISFGGRAYVVAFGKPVVPDHLRQDLTDAFDGQATEVKLYGTNSMVKVTTNYRLHVSGSDVDREVELLLKNTLAKATGHKFVANTEKVTHDSFTIVSSSKVGPTVGEDSKNAARKALFLALLMIFLYIFARFRRWQYGLSAILALIHDTLAVFAALGFAAALGTKYEVDQTFIAAILTVIGYSINDTVVIYDKVREHLQLDSRQPLGVVVNKAINSTMTRTLITSLTTLIAVVVLFLYGGEGLRSFSFTLLVGIVAGTYSSVVIATPLVVDMIAGRKR